MSQLTQLSYCHMTQQTKVPWTRLGSWVTCDTGHRSPVLTPYMVSLLVSLENWEPDVPSLVSGSQFPPQFEGVCSVSSPFWAPLSDSTIIAQTTPALTV